MITLSAVSYTHLDVYKRRAEENGLISAKQKDSYDICFIESGDYRQYLAGTDSNYLVPGEIVDSSGSVVGEHQGLAHYTIGQRDVYKRQW